MEAVVFILFIFVLKLEIMKTIILAALSLIAIGCTTPEIESNNKPQQEQYSECGVIKKTEYTPDGFFVWVKMNKETKSTKFVLVGYMEHEFPIGSTICNFDGLTKVY